MALYYPPVGFHFLVRFEGIFSTFGVPDIGFQEISGLNTEIGIEEYREGGENRFAHRLPNPVSYQNLVLKRGLLFNSQLSRQFKDAVEGFQFEPGDATVILLNDLHLPIQAWNFVNAWPVKWSFEGLNAQDSSIVIESIELSYQYYKRIDALDLDSLI